MIDVAFHLSPTDMIEVARAIRVGRIQPPYTGLALNRLLSAPHDDSVAQEMQRLYEEGLTPQHLALLLESLARTSSRNHDELVDLVCTGPEAPGITNRDTGAVVRELFAGAERTVLVAGYAVYQGRLVFRSLAERMDAKDDIQVRMFLDVQRNPKDTTTQSDLVRRFAQRFKTDEWPGKRLPEVYYDPRSLDPDPTKRSCLHAKCIVIDGSQSFVSSANFTEAAQSRNIEVGALIKSETFSVRLHQHFESLLAAGIFQPISM